ncbi:MAG: AAA family ATPase [Acidobacteria bacterium]|nr:AAA family ATPase [Acidobacteriota bacterium]
MIIRGIEVEGFRCFDRLVALDSFAPGLNIIYGPNGVGKSTLLRALRHVLVDAHSLSGAAVKQAMIPWGRSLSPRIRVTMEHGGVEWRLEKRFLSGSFARLERREEGGFRPFAEGKDAESRVRAMLLADAAPKGMAADAHLGLLQLLWTPQGPPALPEWSPGVRTTLQEAFGAALSSKAADRLTALAGERFDEYFSPTGKTKVSSPVARLQQELGQAQHAWQFLDDQWRQAGAQRETLAKLRAGIDRDSAMLAMRTPELEQARARREELTEATAAEWKARQEFTSLDARAQTWRTGIAARHDYEQKERDAKARHLDCVARLRTADEFRPKLQELERDLENLQASGADAKAWPDLLRAAGLDRLRTTLRAQLQELRAPDASAMQEINRLHQQVQIKQAALAAASLRVTVQAETALTIEAGGAGHRLDDAQIAQFEGPQNVTLRIPGVAKITAASANAQAAGLANELASLQSELAARLADDTYAALESRFSAAQELQKKLDAADAEFRPLEPRRDEFAELRKKHPEWVQKAPEIEQIRTTWRQRKEALDVARTQFDFPALAAAEATAKTLLDNISAQLGQVRTSLAQQEATGTLEALEARRAESQIELAVARTRLAAVQLHAAADPAAIEQEVRSVTAAIQSARETAARLEGELAATQSQNLYGRLAEAEERVADRQGELDRHSRRAAAIQLLKETLAGSQRAVTAALPDRIAELATGYWRRIAGDKAPAIKIGNAWNPDGLIVPDASPLLDEISGGEAEQVAFATRLALAVQLAASGPHLAVFDDAFLATDPARAERVVSLLTEAAGQLQILILTCHPARYAGLSGVRQFDLAALKG